MEYLGNIRCLPIEWDDFFSGSCSKIAENKSNEYNQHFLERHLQCIWYDERLRPAIKTIDGQAVIVKNPGNWNLGPGPDFFNAVLLVGKNKKCFKGDVEIHIYPDDWNKHRHEGNKEYSNVIAHVTYYPNFNNDNNKNMIKIALKDSLDKQSDFFFDSIDISAYPYEIPTNKYTPCRELMRLLPFDEQIALIKSAGKKRLFEKSLRAKRLIEQKGRDQAFYEEFMGALGYKSNTVPFRKIAELFPIYKIEGVHPLRVYANYLGKSGLLPDRFDEKMDNETKRYVRKIWDIWWKNKERLADMDFDVSSWRFAGVRPSNRPERRLCAAANMFSKKDFITKLLRVPVKDPVQWCKIIKNIILNASEYKYWNYRYTFLSDKTQKKVALIGEKRIKIIIINVIIPFLWASKVDISNLLSNIHGEGENTISKKMADILFGHDYNSNCFSNILLSQGLIHIFNSFCLNNKGECDKCKFSAILQKLQK